MGGIPDKVPKIQRIAILDLPKEKSEDMIAMAKDTGTAINIEIATTRKVPHIAGISP